MAKVEQEGIFYVLDTEVENISESFIVKGLNGTQGDSLRKVNLAIKEGTTVINGKVRPKPMNLAGLAVRFRGKDSNGKRKYVDAAYEIINESGGLVSLTLPAEVFAAHGDYQSAFIQIYDPAGDKVQSTFKVALTVIENDVMFTTNPSEDYIDRVESLIAECTERIEIAEKTLNNRVEKFDETLKTQEMRANSIEEMLKNLIKLVETQGVPTFSGDNVYTGLTEFTQFIKGYTTGNSVAFFGANQEQQNLDSIDGLRELRAFTTKVEYFSSNKVLNNPTRGDMFYMLTEKVSTNTVMQRIFRLEDSGYGIIKMRRVHGLDSEPVLGKWGTVAEWGTDWLPLTKYLTKDFVAGTVAPAYKIVGDEVRIRGNIKAAKTLSNSLNDGPNGNNWTAFKDLPFELLPGQDRLKIGSGANFFALFAGGREIGIQKHQNGGSWREIPAGGYMGISGHYDIKGDQYGSI